MFCNIHITVHPELHSKNYSWFLLFILFPSFRPHNFQSSPHCLLMNRSGDFHSDYATGPTQPALPQMMVNINGYYMVNDS